MRDDIAIQEPIKRHVALQRDFRQHNEIALVLSRTLSRPQDALDVARIIAVRRIDLPDGDAHELILNAAGLICDARGRGWRRPHATRSVWRRLAGLAGANSSYARRCCTLDKRPSGQWPCAPLRYV